MFAHRHSSFDQEIFSVNKDSKSSVAIKTPPPEDKSQASVQRAIEKRNWPAVEAFLKHKPDIDLITSASILAKSLFSIDRENLVKKLLDCKLVCTPETLSFEEKQLIITHPALLEIFMKQYPDGISAAEKLKDGHSWLTLLACNTGNPDCLHIILKNPIYKSALLNKPGKENLTAIQWAIQKGYWSIAKDLLEHKPHIDLQTSVLVLQKNPQLFEKIKYCELKCVPAELTHKEKQLIITHLPLLKIFMEHYPDGISAAEQLESNTWLTLLASHPESWSSIERMRLILTYRTYGPALLNKPSKDGSTPIAVAADNKNWEMVSTLLDHNPAITISTYAKILDNKVEWVEKLQQCNLQHSDDKIKPYEQLQICRRPDMLKHYMKQYPHRVDEAAKGLSLSDNWLTVVAYDKYILIACLELILADPNYGPALLNAPGAQRKTAVEWAAQGGNWAKVALLLQYNPALNLATYQRIVKANATYPQLKLIDLCHATTDGARLYSKILLDQQKEAKKRAEETEKVKQLADQKISAATTIQTYCRLYLERKKTTREEKAAIAEASALTVEIAAMIQGIGLNPIKDKKEKKPATQENSAATTIDIENGKKCIEHCICDLKNYSSQGTARHRDSANALRETLLIATTPSQTIEALKAAILEFSPIVDSTSNKDKPKFAQSSKNKVKDRYFDIITECHEKMRQAFPTAFMKKRAQQQRTRVEEKARALEQAWLTPPPIQPTTYTTIAPEQKAAASDASVVASSPASAVVIKPTKKDKQNSSPLRRQSVIGVTPSPLDATIELQAFSNKRSR